MASDTYTSPHFFVAMGHPWASNIPSFIWNESVIISHDPSLFIFFPIPPGSFLVSEQPRFSPRIGWTKHWKSDTSSLMGKKHMKQEWWFQSSIVSSNPILGGLSDYIPLYHIISALVLILDVIPSMLLVKSPFITILQLVYQPLVG